jgi:outer membrane protein
MLLIGGLASRISSAEAAESSEVDNSWFHALDLNEYALGAYYFRSQSFYVGVEDFALIVPLPSTFEHAVYNQNVFFIRDGNVGLRKILDSGWEMGGLVGVQTLGYNSSQSPELTGMSRRDWSVQLGGFVGRPIGPFRADVQAETDILNRHGGQEYTFKFAMPFQGKNWQFVPQIDVLYQTEEVVDYYFGVTEPEARPGRPAYSPGAATTYGLSADISYRFHPKWYVSLTAGMDFLPEEISNSPISGRDRIGRIVLSIAYDAPAFVSSNDQLDPLDFKSFSFGIGGYYATADSSVDVLGNPVNPNSDDSLGETKWAPIFDVAWRLRKYHRVEFSYLKLERSASTTLDEATVVRNQVFNAGETITRDFDTSLFKASYGFSLIQDSQKELTVLAGLQVTTIDDRTSGAGDSVDLSTTSYMPLIGAHLTVSPLQGWSGLFRLEYFNLTINEHEGSMLHVSAAGQYQISDNFAVGGGYMWYMQKITSDDSDFPGEIQLNYRGPTVFARARF